ncbi:MAG TPA: TonB-dependent receptor [Candidatus Marinimicrobia bacterium]|nr:TonB-dependent receptor [Candidatus Neomarinimicrobiota bacterium]
MKTKLTKWIMAMAAASLLMGQTGKISGRVTDAASGDALIGVNVLVQNSVLGAATDANGEYVILNVPPGAHSLFFSYIGYGRVLIQDIEVKMERTVRVDAQMAVEAYQGETVVVTAERPIVEADKTHSSIHIEADEIANMPVEGLRNVLELNPSINRNADGTLSIRGGGSYEINYSVNGIKSMNTNTSATAFGGSGMEKADNSWKYDVNPLAVAQMEVISGGFNAEYGNAQSGVVKVVTREGGEKFSGGFRMEYRPPGQYHWGDYLYSKNQFEWQAWGDTSAWLNSPQFIAPDGTVNDSAAINNYNLWIQNHTPEGEKITLYQYDEASGRYIGRQVENGENIMGVYDYRQHAYQRYLFSFGGPLGKDSKKMNFFLSGEYKEKPNRVPTVEQVQRMNNYSLVIAWHPSPKHTIKITNMYQYLNSGMGSGSDDIRWAGLGGWTGSRKKYTLIYDALREETVVANNINYKFLFSPEAYWELSLTHQFEELFSLQRPVPGIDKDAQLVSQGRQETRYLEDRGPWFMNYRDYYTWSSLYNQASLTHYYELRTSYSNQLTRTNLLKIGGEIWLMDQNYNASSSLTVSSFIWRTGFSTNYQAKTKYAAAYIQDKLEFAGMVANLGLRLDAYNFGSDEVPVDENQVFYPAGNENFPGGIGIPAWEKSKTFVTLSPRIGISFPVAEKTAFRVQYGHFRSMPGINQALDNQTNHGWGILGNPNLEPKLSVNYEIGLQQNLWDSHQLDIVTYYNDLKKQVHTVYKESSAGSIKYTGDYYGTYRTYSNNSHGSSQGLELNFSNRTVSAWRYRLGYALSQTKIGYSGNYIILEEMTPELEQKYTYSASEFTSGENRTHRFNGSLTYVLNEGQGPVIAGLALLENSSFGLIYRVSSGTAYYWAPDYVTDAQIENNRRYPLESSTDMQMEKRLNVSNIQFTIQVKIRNLYDNKQLTPIADAYERDRWVKRSATFMDPDIAPNRDYHLFNYFQAYKNIPREMYFTIGIDF